MREFLQEEINNLGPSLAQTKTTVTLQDREFVTGCLLLHDVYKVRERRKVKVATYQGFFKTNSKAMVPN